MKHLVLLLPLVLAAQAPPLNYATLRCGTNTPGNYYLLMTGPAAYPLCLVKGPTLKVTTVNGQATLDMAAPPTATGSVAVALDDGAPLPSRPVLRIRSGMGVLPVVTDTGTEIVIQLSIDTAVVALRPGPLPGGVQ